MNILGINHCTRIELSCQKEICDLQRSSPCLTPALCDVDMVGCSWEGRCYCPGGSGVFAWNLRALDSQNGEKQNTLHISSEVIFST